MSVTLAVLTSDANLLACELTRLKGRVQLDGQGTPHVAGVGWYAQDNVLLRRFSFGTTPASPEALAPGADSEVLIYVSAPADVTRPIEDAAQPCRFRNWLFGFSGEFPDFERLRPTLLAALPDFLRRQLAGDGASEIAFAFFLKQLRDAGRTDDPGLDGALGAQFLGRTVKELQGLARDKGLTQALSLNLIASNGRVLMATRSNREPLYYTLLEGSPQCERCKLDAGRAQDELALRAHRRRKTVVMASHPGDPAGWIELPPGHAVAVDVNLRLQRVPL